MASFVGLATVLVQVSFLYQRFMTGKDEERHSASHDPHKEGCDVFPTIKAGDRSQGYEAHNRPDRSNTCKYYEYFFAYLNNVDKRSVLRRWVGTELSCGLLVRDFLFLACLQRRKPKGNVLKQISRAAFGVAMFPCGCDGHVELIPHVHYICAAVLFSILVAFCWIFHKRALQKGHREALRRSKLYLLCGSIIVLAMLVMFIDFITHEALPAVVTRLTFYCERAGLVAFGVSWLKASRVLPVISSKTERYAPFA